MRSLTLVVVSSSCAAALLSTPAALATARAGIVSVDVSMSSATVVSGGKREKLKSFLSKIVSTDSSKASAVASWYDQGARLAPCESWYDSGRRLKDAAEYAERKAVYDARRLVLLPPTGANKPQVKNWPSLGGTAGPHRGAGTMPPPPVRELWTPPAGWTRPTVDASLRPAPLVSSWYDASQLKRLEVLRAEGEAVVARRAELAGLAAAPPRKQRRSWALRRFKSLMGLFKTKKTPKAQATPPVTPSATPAASPLTPAAPPPTPPPTPSPTPSPKASAARPALRKKVRVSGSTPPSGYEWGGTF